MKPDHPLIRYFSYEHLPEKLSNISRHFWSLAQWIDANLPDGAEKTVALRKLLESKDAAVRSALDL